jgi:uncharacterized glyoxalase superfamily protein PhnB
VLWQNKTRMGHQLRMVDRNRIDAGSAVVPVMRYRNLPAAIEWLCRAFGFEKHRLTVSDNGAIQFAQLTLGTAMIMVSSVRASTFDKLLRQPDEVGGAETQVCYFFVADARAHFARAKAAGAQIVLNIERTANGGCSYSCRDPEGHLWNFGTYNPWQRQVVGEFSYGRRRLRLGIVARTAGLLLGAGVLIAPLGAVLDPGEQKPMFSAIVTGSTTAEGSAASAREDSASVSAEREGVMTQQRLTEVLREKDELQKAATELQAQLKQALSDYEVAKQLAKGTQEELVKALLDRDAAERITKGARRQLAIERSARRAAAGVNAANKRSLCALWW